MYKAKGKGEKREIWDGSVLVGHIHRVEYKQEKVTYNLHTGRGNYTCKVVDRWKAVWLDGSPVRDKDSKETVMPTIKAWKQPSTWAERKDQ